MYSNNRFCLQNFGYKKKTFFIFTMKVNGADFLAEVWSLCIIKALTLRAG